MVSDLGFFASDISGALPDLRSLAESLMRDTVRVTREGDPVTDADGFVTASSTLAYEGPAKWQSPSGWQRSQVGESDTAAGGLELHLPFDASAGVRVGDVVECAASLDPSLVGRRFGVFDEFTKTLATARRFRVEVVGR